MRYFAAGVAFGLTLVAAVRYIGWDHEVLLVLGGAVVGALGVMVAIGVSFRI